MNTGQMLLSLGAVLLLSILTLRVNSNQLTTQEAMYNTKFGILAVSLATSFIEEASERAFDEKSIDDFITSPNKFTSSGSFGPEPGINPDSTWEFSDSMETFDDFDDFHDWTETITTMPSAEFNINCQVNYIDLSMPGLITTNKTWNKQLTVYVTSPSMSDTIIITKIFSYWKFP